HAVSEANGRARGRGPGETSLAAAGGNGERLPPEAARRVSRSARTPAAVEPGNRAQLPPRGRRALRLEWRRTPQAPRSAAPTSHCVAVARARHVGPDHRVPALGLARFFQLARQAPRLLAQPL